MPDRSRCDAQHLLVAESLATSRPLFKTAPTLLRKFLAIQAIDLWLKMWKSGLSLQTQDMYSLGPLSGHGVVNLVE